MRPRPRGKERGRSKSHPFLSLSLSLSLSFSFLPQMTLSFPAGDCMRNSADGRKKERSFILYIYGETEVALGKFDAE